MLDMANEVRRKRTRSRTALHLAAVIVCSLAAAWLATIMFGGRVDGRRMTDAALVHVAKLAHLRYFDVTGTKVTIEAAGRLHDSHPGCHITDNWCCGCLAFLPVED